MSQHTTPASGAAIQRFEVVDCIDDKHVPAVIPNPHGPWVRYEDHIAALAAVQATAAQAVVPTGFLHNVIALCTQRGYSPESIEAWSTDHKWIADLWRQAAQMLAAAPAQPAVEASRFGSPELQAMIIARCIEKDQADSVQEDAARESEYRRGYRHGYEQRDAEVRGAMA